MATDSQTRGTGNGREHKGAGTALKRTSSRADPDTGETAGERIRGVVDQLGDALDIKGRIDRHPYGTLAAAIGAGYILGGGFFTPLTGRLFRLALKLGVRLAVLPLLNEEMMTAVGDVLAGGEMDPGSSRQRRSRPTTSEGK